MKKYFTYFLVVLLAFSLLAVAGCSDENDQAADDKVLIVGTEPTFPPFEMKDENTGDIVGFDIDLIKAIAEDQGFEVEIQAMGFDALINSIKSGNIDIVASGMTIDEDRAKEVDFSEAYINSGLALAVAEGNEVIKTEEDLQGKKVATQIGTTGYDKAKELKDQGIVKEVFVFDGVDVAMKELINGGVDAVINDYPVTKAYMAKQEGKIKIVEELTSEDYGFAVKKGSPLLEKINAGLKNVQENGTFDELVKKYFE